MFDLKKENVILQATEIKDKTQALQKVAAMFKENLSVKSDYLASLQAREKQINTYLGNGVAIPHGTLEDRDLILKTDVVILQVPQGIVWNDDGDLAYIIVGICANSNDHLDILKSLTLVVSNELKAAILAKLANVDEFIALLMNKWLHQVPLAINPDLINLDVEYNNMNLVKAVNIEALERTLKISQLLSHTLYLSRSLYLAHGIWLNDTDATINTNFEFIAYATLKKSSSHNNLPLKALLTLSVNKDNVEFIKKFAKKENLEKLSLAKTKEEVIAIFNSWLDNNQTITSPLEQNLQVENNMTTDDIYLLVKVGNATGLHARPVAELAKSAKGFDAKATIEYNNITVPATSAMKILSLALVKDSIIKVIATGTQAKELLLSIKAGFLAGLGEGKENASQILEEVLGADTVSATVGDTTASVAPENSGVEEKIKFTLTKTFNDSLTSNLQKLAKQYPNRILGFNPKIRQWVSLKSKLRLEQLALQAGDTLEITFEKGTNANLVSQLQAIL